MEFKKAIFLMSGEVITITENEEKQIKEMLMKGAEWISVQGELINAKSVAKVGNHHATAYMKKLEGYQNETDKKLAEGDRPQIAEPDFYIDKHTGEKIYS